MITRTNLSYTPAPSNGIRTLLSKEEVEPRHGCVRVNLMRSEWALQVHIIYPHVPQPLRTCALNVMTSYGSSWTFVVFFGHFHETRRHACARGGPS